MTAHAPVPGAGAIVVHYPPGWVPQVGEGAIAIKSPDGFSTFEVGFAVLPSFMRSPDEVVHRIMLPAARRETPDLKILDAHTAPGVRGAREYLVVGTQQGRRFFSNLQLAIVTSLPPMAGGSGSTTIHWVLLGAIPEDQPQPRLNLMVAMARSIGEVLAGGGVGQTPPISGRSAGGSGSTRGDAIGNIQSRCWSEAGTEDDRIHREGKGWGFPTEARRRDRLYKECLARYGVR